MARPVNLLVPGGMLDEHPAPVASPLLHTSSGTMTVSSSTEGFFQDKPRLSNALDDDAALQRCVSMFLPQSVRSRVYPDLHRFGDLVLSPTTIAYMADAERNPPYVQHFDTFGRRVDRLVTSEGWRASAATSHTEGLVAIGYDASYGRHARVYQFLKTHIWSPASCCVTCPSAMHDGAVSLLLRHVAEGAPDSDEAKAVFRSALARLLSRDPLHTWTSGQWMTERTGGSDVRNTETRATFTPDLPADMPHVASDGSVLGPWSVSGFKWFSSATDSDMTVMLAKTGDTDKISAFFAPLKLRRRVTDAVGGEQGAPVSNGIAIQRLKNKLGTKPLPTAELVLSGTRAFLIGNVGEGTKEISAVLNITRLHTGACAVADWGRGLAIARAYSRVRQVGGRPLSEVPAHVKTLAALHLEYRAFSFFLHLVSSLLGATEHPHDVPGENQGQGAPVPEDGTAAHLLRLLGPVFKATASLAAVAGLRACMEALGGVGYLENEDAELNVAALFRAANVQPIWEGTTDVQGADVLRVLRGRSGERVLVALEAWVANAMSALEREPAAVERISAFCKGFVESLRTAEANRLLYYSREVMDALSWLVCAVLLHLDAARDADPVAREVSRRWLDREARLFFSQSKSSGTVGSESNANWLLASEWDRGIVFGATCSNPDSKL